jgi:diguanylate cyclase
MPETTRSPGAGADQVRRGARLAALHRLGLLDSPLSETFDRLTRAATAMLATPVSLLSLVDEDRQFFLSHQGLEGELADLGETPLSHSLCRHVVAERSPLIVADARECPLVADNLAVRDLDVIAYAGAPLIVDGEPVGALCAIDHQPRAWTTTEISFLQDLAATAGELIELRSALAQAGLHDRLTDLPNRSLLVEMCQQMLSGGGSAPQLAVMCVGMDDFTQINQALGTERADAVLVAAARRLSEILRPTDFLGRLRGDMFVVIADHIADERAALALAGRIRDQFAGTPLRIDGEPLLVSATVGIALPTAGSRAADLITESASAMRQAKQHHSRTQVSRAGWTEVAAARVRIRQALGTAVERGEIRAVFQPIVALESGRIVAYETLARWRHPELGDVGPIDFIPAAESTGDIVRIGEWMLAQACRRLAAWRADGHDVYVTVNLAPLQLQQPRLADVVLGVLADHGLPGASLALEITESALLGSDGQETDTLDRLRRAGIRIALDDFGTGYSALGYLKRFPIDILKIDRSFITGIEDQRYDAALIQAILAMAKNMDLAIVAEGIETRGQHQLLRLLGADSGQGYRFSAPQEADATDPAATFE